MTQSSALGDSFMEKELYGPQGQDAHLENGSALITL